MNEKTLFIVAAGSGGHILPALQLAQQWKQQNPNGNIIFFTGTSELEKKIIKNRPYLTDVKHLSMSKFSLRRWWLIPFILVQFITIFFKSLFYSLKYQPEKIVSTGGLMSVPVCIAVRCCARRVEAYNLDMVPGKAVKALLPFAHTIFITFPQTRQLCKLGRTNYSHKCQDVAYPLRFTNKDRSIDHNAVIDRINAQLQQQKVNLTFNSSRKTLFVLGGSQGSSLLNSLIKHYLEDNIDNIGTIQVIHQTGAVEEAAWYDWYASHNVPALIFSYDERINEYYVLADLIICRAGAGTIFEVAFFNKPCVVIPLIAQTTSHQIQNAHAIAEQYPQLFTVLEQDLVVKNPNIFSEIVNAKL